MTESEATIQIGIVEERWPSNEGAQDKRNASTCGSKGRKTAVLLIACATIAIANPQQASDIAVATGVLG
jgi:hypothetical protein